MDSAILVNIIPDLLNMVLVWLAVLMLFIVVKKKFYNKFKIMINARQDYIAKEILEANSIKEDAKNLQIQRQKELMSVRQEALQIINVAKNNATTISNEIISKAKNEAIHKADLAEKAIKHERESFKAEIKNEIVDVAISAAGQIISEELDSNKHKMLVQEFIDEI